MQVELVQTTTGDGVRLDGVLLTPDERRATALDAWLLIHGTTANFYGGLILSRLGYLRDAGYAAASFNTRGHDVVSTIGPGRPVGTAYEDLDDCRLDLDAAISWLASQGYARIGLLGQSMGAVKVIYYQAHVQDPRVAAVVAVSPVRLSRSYYLSSEARDEYEQTYERARQLVESGNPDALLRVTFPNPTIFGAKSYLKKYGSEHYNVVNYANKLQCPLLVMGGTLETHPRLRDCAKDVYFTVAENPGAKLVLIEGGSHNLPEMREELANTLVQWVSETLQTNLETSVVS